MTEKDRTSITPGLDAGQSLTGMFDLVGQVAFISGGYGGLGEAIAYGLAMHGARVVIGGRDGAKANAQTFYATSTTSALSSYQAWPLARTTFCKAGVRPTQRQQASIVAAGIVRTSLSG